MLAEAVERASTPGDAAAMLAAAERAHALLPAKPSAARPVPRRDGQRHGARGHGRRRRRRGAESRRGVAHARALRRAARRSRPARRGPAIGPLFLREAETGRAPDRARARATARGAGRARRAAVACCMHARARPGDHRPAGRRPRPSYDEAIAWPARPASRPSSLRRSPASRGSRPARAGRRRAGPTPPRRCDAVRRARRRPARHLGAAGAGRSRARARPAPTRAAAHLEELGRLLRAARDRRRRPLAGARAGRGLPPARAGRRRARPGRRALEAQAEAKGQPWALARAARSRGLLADDDEFDALFDAGARRCTRRRRTCSRRPAPGWPTASACAGRGARATPASSCAPRSTTSTGSAPRRGPSWPAPSSRRPARRRAGATAGTRRPAHAAGAADRAAARRREDDPGGRGRAVPQPEDHRVPPAQRLPQARHPLAELAEAMPPADASGIQPKPST